MSRPRRSPHPGVAHYAAPIAFLAGVTIAVLLVHSALSHHTTSVTTTTSPATSAVSVTTKHKAKQHGTTEKFYVVQAGDTFGTIASKEGISIEQLQSLNPGVSSNALQVGQKLRVR